jgi:alkanesulfonate monooxygenase SsuD/methylene tetrahydromethanopterin reductase-like flavin-dependent oxidoreductase (luciferase family)
VLYQAGQSSRGSAFAARHAEVVFVTLGALRGGAELVADLRRRAEAMGRDPGRLKVLQGTGVIVARTSEEARARADEFVRLTSAGGVLTKWCGWTGVDLAAYAAETPLSEVRGQDMHSVLGTLRQAAPDRVWTVADVRDFVAVPKRPHRFTRLMLFGTAAEVADRMEEWIARTGIDGFNLSPCPPSAGIDDLCDLLVPELQRRGLLRTAYDPAEPTLRERYFGAGNRRFA